MVTLWLKRESAAIYSTKCHHVSTSIECLGPPSRNRRISERYCMTWTIASPFLNRVGCTLFPPQLQALILHFFSRISDKSIGIHGRSDFLEAEFGASVLFDRDGTMCSTLRCSLLPYPPFECACSFYFLLHFLDDFLLDRDSMYIIFTLPIIPYILRALELRNP